MTNEDDGIKRYDLIVKVDGNFTRYDQVAIRREKKIGSYQLLTTDFELIDLEDVEFIFNHTLFDAQWERLIRSGHV